MKIQEAILTNKYVYRKDWDNQAFCYHLANTGPFKDLVTCDYFTMYEDGFISFSTTGPDLYAEEFLADDYKIAPLTASQIEEAVEKNKKMEEQDFINKVLSKTVYSTLTKLPNDLRKQVLFKVANGVINQKVEEWHNLPSETKSLPEYLKMTDSEYNAWVEKTDTLPEKLIIELLKEYNEFPAKYKTFI